MGRISEKRRVNVFSGHGFKEGIKDGVPIALGYLSVSFGFGISAVNAGIPSLAAILISMTNLTSAGQVAGIAIIAAGGSVLEMALTQLVINIRYSLMGLSLTQKLSGAFTTPHRLMVSFGITDEVFAVASSKTGQVGPSYMYGLILLPFICWTSGTVLGAYAGSVLPVRLRMALGIAIYGMFLAIIVPPLRRNRGVAIAVFSAAAMSCILRYMPLLNKISRGFAIIICAVAGSALAAAAVPVSQEDNDAGNVGCDGLGTDNAATAGRREEN